MAIRIPNPCDDVVEPSGPGTGAPSGEDNQGTPPVYEPAEFAGRPSFVERTITFPATRAERTISLIDKEFSTESTKNIEIHDESLPSFNVLTPAWFIKNKFKEGHLSRVAEAPAGRGAGDAGPGEQTLEFNESIIDPFRAATLFLWKWSARVDDAELQPGVIPPAPKQYAEQIHRIDTGLGSYSDISNFNIPVEIVYQHPEIRDNNTMVTETRIFLYPRPGIARTNTNQYSDFSGEANKFFDTYYSGMASNSYRSLPTALAKEVYRVGVLPNLGSSYVDSCFESSLPFYKREVNHLNIPAFQVVDIHLESRGFITGAFGETRIVSEYQKPSIYSSFYQDKTLETLQLDSNIVQSNNCIPSDRIHKFTSDRVEMMQEANAKLESQSESFVRIQIATNQGGSSFIAQLLRNSKMDRHVLDLITSKGEYESREEVFTQIMKDAVYADTTGPDGDRFQPGDDFTRNDRGGRTAKFKVNDKFIEKVEDQVAIVDREQDISEYPMGYYNHDKPLLLSFEDTITSQIFLEELRQYISASELDRTFAEILHGKKAHSEVIGYHVEKADAETGEVIQDFYFSDSNEVLEIDFIDNQILKGKKYRYRVYAINIVLATKYTYTNVSKPALADIAQRWASADLVVGSELKYHIIESPYFEKKVSVFDQPPMFPQVSFLPYQGVEDKIAFLLQDNGGKVTELPIPVLEEDEEKFIEMSEAQDKNYGDKLLYGSDDLPTGFEALCITQEHLIQHFERDEPDFYSDFKDAEVKSFPAHGKTGFFKMDIEPNKYYYIIFRTKEEQMVSNPTEVYRFMMVSYENGIYFDVQTIEMETVKYMDPITFERVISIEPNMSQYLLSIGPDPESQPSAEEVSAFMRSAPDLTEEQIGHDTNVDNPEAVPEILWGKKMKIKIKSASTCKTVDLNVVFNRSVKTRERPTPESQEREIPSVCPPGEE
tara:strand:+ start:2464 stop:5289 length:2826 start_codon:yes stop_codon:yes gene_type:complete